ncbi:MAG TPA: sigma-70 family RNA polymerase sigma factor [Gemmataceae bacterium]|nr:sigma-70 family RNA polymerase sigma factor [Gemmataceae bacterium]
MSGPSTPDPEQLLRQAQAGDSQALGELLELYRNYLTVLARLQIGRQLQGKVDASDVVQDTFLKAHRDFARFRGETEGEWISWLRQVLTGCLIQLIRHYCGTQRRNVRLERALAQELDQTSQALDQGLVARQSSPSHQAVRRERAVLVADALGSLPDDYREVILLSHFEGMSFPEVARHMGRSLDSVKNLWARALVRLRRALRDRL